MKEIIAERDKSFFMLITGVGLLSTTAAVIALILLPKFLYVYIGVIAVMGFFALVGLIGLCFPKWVIIREEDTIVIQNGYRNLKKQVIKLSDIVDAKIQTLPQQSAAKQNGNIILTIKNGSSATKNLIVINIKNHSAVVEKLNSLIADNR